MADPLIPIQSLDPTKVKAIITTRWSGSAYKSATIRRIESYSISSQLDSDADPWSLDVGNPDADLNPVLTRDNEVRVQVFGAGQNTTVPLLNGFMDDVTYTEQGTLSMTGRDMSAIPVDSDHFPMVYRNMSPTKIIELEARELGFSRFSIQKINGGPLKQETDGSEKYWEFWYRMVRKDGYYIWVTAAGTLVVSKLHYNYAPAYSFASAKVATKKDILVESMSWHKTTQGRFHRLGMVWRQQAVATGSKPSITILKDPGTNYWLKQPQKLVEDKHVSNVKTANKYGQEEIYESKVGAIEITLTVQDPGFLIQQDKVAFVNLPEYGIKGNWYVVGSTIRGDTSGFQQDVRLRERHIAISERVPDDPVWTKDTKTTTDGGTFPSGQAAKNLYDNMRGKEDWWPCFLNAGKDFAGKFDIALFTAYLLAICDHETGFTNERSVQFATLDGNSHMTAPGEHWREWKDIRPNYTTQEYAKFRTDFCNEGGDGVVPSGYEAAVGPMQLFTPSFKREADTLTGGGVNELFGDRWTPCNNISVAAKALAEKAVTVKGSEVDLMIGVCKYGNEGFDPKTGQCGYSIDIHHRVHVSPNWLQLVQDALASVQPGSGGQPQGKWVFPVDGQTAYNFNDGGGPCGHVWENGANDIWQDNSAHDIMAKGGTKIYALSDGRIGSIGSSQSSGPGGHAYGIYIESSDGSEWYYAHMTGDSTGNSIVAPKVGQGDKIVAGDLVAYTNRWDGHLHLAINSMDKQVDANSCKMDADKCDPILVFRSKIES